MYALGLKPSQVAIPTKAEALSVNAAIATLLI